MTYALEELKKMMADNAGDLYLSGCTGLTSLPEGLAVSGDLYLAGCTGIVDKYAERKKPEYWLMVNMSRGDIFTRKAY